MLLVKEDATFRLTFSARTPILRQNWRQSTIPSIKSLTKVAMSQKKKMISQKAKWKKRLSKKKMRFPKKAM